MEQELERLSQLFLKFPGIGNRQARRFAYFILSQSDQYVTSLAHALLEVRKHSRTCILCLRVFEGNSEKCPICSDESRDHSTVVVVEKSQDIDSFKKTDYGGVFFVLGGLIPIIQKSNVKHTNLQLLQQRVRNQDANFSEIILAFPLTPNGENTDIAVREALVPIAKDIKISSLGRGLSSGAELEYADATSLNASLKKRE